MVGKCRFKPTKLDEYESNPSQKTAQIGAWNGYIALREHECKKMETKRPFLDIGSVLQEFYLKIQRNHYADS